jgi:hypothetical protein
VQPKKIASPEDNVSGATFSSMVPEDEPMRHWMTK